MRSSFLPPSPSSAAVKKKVRRAETALVEGSKDENNGSTLSDWEDYGEDEDEDVEETDGNMGRRMTWMPRWSCRFALRSNWRQKEV